MPDQRIPKKVFIEQMWGRDLLECLEYDGDAKGMLGVMGWKRAAKN